MYANTSLMSRPDCACVYQLFLPVLYLYMSGVRRNFVGGWLHWWPKVKNRRRVGRLRITLPEPEAGADPGESKGGVPSAGRG